MAKKTAAKKSKRRLKRTARRSMAAVLMITAVVVAAIPVPENVAADPSTPGADATINVPTEYPYPKHNDKGEMLDISGTTVKKLCTGEKKGNDPSLAKPADAAIYKSNTVTRLSDGQYQLGWQFKFFQVTVDGYDRGIICEYNSTYQQDVVDLEPNAIYEYDKITEADYNNWFTEDKNSDSKADNDLTFTLGQPNTEFADQKDLTNPDWFFNKYFPELYKQQIAAYDEYKKNMEEYKQNLNKPGVDLTNPPTEPSKPVDMERKVTQLTPDQKLEYYCDATSTGTTNQKFTGREGCKLVPVIDPPESSSTSASASGPALPTVYIPQKIGFVEGNKESHFDNYGLHYVNQSTIIGIGNEAFKGTKNVSVLNVPEEVKYIGKSAFENSFIKEIAFNNVGAVCDYAFKGCEQLTKVDFGKQVTTMIGVEAFYGTKLTNVEFPTSIKEIGPGAFAYCESLQGLDFSKISATPALIHEYAFYNAVSLNSVNFMQNPSQAVNIDTIGDAAFAVQSGVVGTLSEFAFPSKISKTRKDSVDGHGLGNCVLAGRSNLTKVVMPAEFGKNPKATVPADTFYNCYNLGCVEFPADGNGSCGLANFNGSKETGLFRTISNPDFYVQGPELDMSRSIASPRKSTWDAKTAVSDVVPYLYVKNGLNYYEISNGEYLMCVDNKGILTSCVRKDPSTPMVDVDLEIPAKVGSTNVTGIASDCFSDKNLNDNVRSLRIADDSQIALINSAAFQGWEKLSRVYIGNSVTQIGNNAFAGCKKLIDVTFSSPKGGYKSFQIGTDAFKTGSDELTFHGDIVKGYAPFDWATDKDNIIKEPDGIRVCYQSLSPTFLTVMYDENTGLVTLLDYPKMNQVSELLNEAHADEIKDGKYGTYEAMREAQSYVEYSSDAFDTRRESFKTEWMTNKEKAYDSEFYGPWITPDFCATAGTWGTTSGSGTSGGATSDPGTSGGTTSDPDTSGGSTRTDVSEAIADFFFDPLVVYAADGDGPLPYYSNHHFEVGAPNTEFPSLTSEEINLLDSVRNIVVPDGVDSIDVFGYITKSDRNKLNAETYLQKKLGTDIWRMYYNSGIVSNDTDGAVTKIPGLFSGYYDDKLNADKGEKYKRGNDQITSVKLNSVKYLPDYAFDSCENLLNVDLGPACSDIGTAPFRGCYEMSTVGDNEYYTAANGIIYSKNEDGSLTIEECLAARGRKTEAGPAIVSASNDENMKIVSAIKPGAFEDCDFLTAVDFGSDDTDGLLEIPEACFRNCDNLQNVVLPKTVNDVGKHAFAGANALRDLTVYGDEVKISGSAFDSNKTVQTTVRAYEDSAVVRYVKEYGDAYKLYYDKDHPLGRQWKVTFYDAKYKLAENMKDDQGKALDNPQYVADGEKAVIPMAPVLDGWTFENWAGMNNADISQPIRGDVIFYAKGHYNGGAPIDGKYTVEFFDGVDGQQLVGRRGFNPDDGKYYVPEGTSFADNGWLEPEHPVHVGFEPFGFSSGKTDGSDMGAWTVDTKVNSNLTIVALYKAASTSGGSTSGGTTSSGTTSGSTTSTPSTNTSKNTTSNKTSSDKSSSSSSSSSSTSSSSTSSSSTTSGTTSGAGQYTVFVEGGSGSGSYSPGTTVIISCYAPAEGMRFEKWTTDSNGVALASVSMTTTTFTMPSNNVTVKANYVEAAAAPSVAVNTGGGTGGTGNGTTTDGDGNTRVDIQKPGISNRDLATANTNGSTDNFIVKISETDEATRAVSAALTNKYGTLDNILYYAMDISLYDSTGTTKITDTTGLSVDITIPIPDSLVAYGGNNMAGAVINGDQLESLNENFTTINGVPCVRFRATHFSPYTIYVDTGNLVEGELDVTPKTGDPIHPKWFLSLGLACLSVILFMKRDKKVAVKA